MLTLSCIIKYGLFSIIVLVLSLISCESNNLTNKNSAQNSSFKGFYSGISQIRDLSFIDSTRLWLLTEKERGLLSTIDGGITWNRVQPENVGRIDRINFLDDQHGWIISKEGYRGVIWQTADGGRSWTKISTLTSEDSKWEFTSAVQIKFVDEMNGWIIETFSVWRSEDGGRNWRQVFPLSSINIQGQPTRGFFLSKFSTWISATDGEIYKTTDGGQNWKVLVVDRKVDFKDIYFIENNTGWLSPAYSSFNNHLYYTDDGGETWKELATLGKDIYIKSTYFINGREGWCVGRRLLEPKANITPGNIDSKSEGILLQTKDGGKSWRAIQVEEGNHFYDRAYFTDTKNGWLFARDNVYKTIDGGEVWSPVLKLAPIK